MFPLSVVIYNTVASLPRNRFMNACAFAACTSAPVAPAWEESSDAQKCC